MIARGAATLVFLLLAAGGFLGAAPWPAGPLNPFGIICLALSGVVWLGWEMIDAAYAYRKEVCPNQGHVFLQTELYLRRSESRRRASPVRRMGGA